MQKHFVIAIRKTMREICTTWFANKAEFCQSRTLFKGLPWGHQLFSKVLLNDRRRYAYMQYEERPGIKLGNVLLVNNSTNTRNLWVHREDTDGRETFLHHICHFVKKGKLQEKGMRQQLFYPLSIYNNQRCWYSVLTFLSIISYDFFLLTLQRATAFCNIVNDV